MPTPNLPVHFLPKAPPRRPLLMLLATVGSVYWCIPAISQGRVRHMSDGTVDVVYALDGSGTFYLVPFAAE